MLKSYIGGHPKCVLIVGNLLRRSIRHCKLLINYIFLDHVKLDRLASKLISTWTNGGLVIDLCSVVASEVGRTFSSELNEFLNGTLQRCPAESVIFMPISQLALQYQAAAIFQMVHQLKRQCKQVFIWANPRDLDDHIIIPFLEHMCTVLVTLIDSVNLSVVTKKSTGSVDKKVI